MNKVSPQQVRHIAHLSRLQLTDQEVRRLQDDLSSILDYFDQMRELDTEGVEPTVHPSGVHTVLRPDVTQPSYPPSIALGNAPATDGVFFRVPKVLDQSESG